MRLESANGREFVSLGQSSGSNAKMKACWIIFVVIERFSSSSLKILYSIIKGNFGDFVGLVAVTLDNLIIFFKFQNQGALNRFQ